MRSYLLFLTFCFLCCSILKAQQDRVFNLQPAVGINGCQVHGDSYNGYNKFGLFVGAAVEASLGKKTGLQLGFYFSQKGAKHLPNNKTGNYDYYRLNLNYIDMPLSLRYSIKSWFITLGPSVAYLAGYNENINYTDMTGHYPFNKFEYGVNIGLGKTIKEHWRMELRCSNSIATVRPYGVNSTVYYSSPVAQLFNEGLYNNILTLFLAYRINLD